MRFYLIYANRVIALFANKTSEVTQYLYSTMQFKLWKDKMEANKKNDIFFVAKKRRKKSKKKNTKSFIMEEEVLIVELLPCLLLYLLLLRHQLHQNHQMQLHFGIHPYCLNATQLTVNNVLVKVVDFPPILIGIRYFSRS